MTIICLLGVLLVTDPLEPIQFQDFDWGLPFSECKKRASARGLVHLKEKAPSESGFRKHKGWLQYNLHLDDSQVFSVRLDFDRKGLVKVYVIDHSKTRSESEVTARYAQLRQQMRDKGWDVEDRPKVDGVYDNLRCIGVSGEVEMHLQPMPFEVLGLTLTIEYHRRESSKGLL